MLLENKQTHCERCDKKTKHEDQGSNLPSNVRWKCTKCGYRNLIEVTTSVTSQELLNEG